jgi:two-component system, NarL family, response regulator DevR
MNDGGESTIGVLLIDDHRAFAESLARLLADEPDISVVGIATTGAEGLDMAVRLLPQVALIDYHLPEQDGVTIAAEIKQREPQIKVVMLTGSADDRVLLAAIDVGCSGFLTKDRAAAEIVDGVRAAASGEALISPALLARLLPKLSRSHRALGSDLTERELEILARLAAGGSNKVIADELYLSVNTVRNYVQSILEKLGTHSKLEAVSTAVREGIIDYPGRQ